MRVGLLTDTHLPSTVRHAWDEVCEVFDGVDLILPGGDIVTPGMLDWLEDTAPTLAARGNNDQGWEDSRMLRSTWAIRSVTRRWVISANVTASHPPQNAKRL